MLHVSGPLRSIFNLAFVPDQFLQDSEGLVQINPLSRGHVEHAPCDFAGWRLASQQIRINRIIHVGEIAALLAVSEDRGLFSLEHLDDELGQHARIRRGRILSWPKNIEVAQARSEERRVGKECRSRWSPYH